MRLKASDTGGIWPYEKRLTPRYFIPPQSGPMGVLKRLLTKIGQELAPICESKPVEGFRDYVMDKWKQHLPKPETE